jgi:hypothetical protein
LIRFGNDHSSTKNSFDIQVPAATATGTLLVFCACVPQRHCHQEIDMLDAQTRQPRNLTVDGITINVLSLPEAVTSLSLPEADTSVVSAAQHGDNFCVCAQKVGLEWAWRTLCEPHRFGPRYARCIAVVPRLVARTIPQIVNARMRKAA